MSSDLANNIQNLVELQEIKNFKTQKFKHRKKDLASYYSKFQFHHPLQFICTPNFNCLRIYQVTPSSSVLSDISLLQIASTLQLSIISTSCVKMSLTIVLLLSIVASHLANSQSILARDNNILFFSENNLSEQYVKLKQNVINKRLIVDSTSTINNEIVKHDKALKSSHPVEKLLVLQTVDIPQMRQSNRSQEINNNDYKQFEPKRITNEILKGYTSYQNARTSDNQNIFEISKPHQQIQNTERNSYQGSSDNQYLLKIVMEGLGLRRLPDFKKANISQLEYATKYNEYLDRVRERNLREFSELDNLVNQLGYENSNTSLSLLTIPHNSSEAREYRQKRSTNKDRTSPSRTILLKFPLNIENDLEASDIEEANIRLLLITSPALATTGPNRRRHRIRAHRGGTDSAKSHLIELDQKGNKSDTHKKKKHSVKPQKHILNMKVYQLLEPKGKVWIDGRKIEIKIDREKMDETISQWLQFDVTKAVEGWLVNKQRNLGLEIQCDNCFRNGARIIDDLSGDSEEDTSNTDEYDLTPVLNIVGRLGIHREKRSKHYHNEMTEKPQHRLRKSTCYKDNQRCCRHTMEVVFKEIKGFEFIIQPKVFDAGYCRGRCPPRYNPAHHHALLQSLIWKQNRTKVPRPCCAPSKLIELEVLHVDEKDNEKLKISTWTDMQVLECSCS